METKKVLMSVVFLALLWLIYERSLGMGFQDGFLRSVANTRLSLAATGSSQQRHGHGLNPERSSLPPTESALIGRKGKGDTQSDFEATLTPTTAPTTEVPQPTLDDATAARHRRPVDPAHADARLPREGSGVSAPNAPAAGAQRPSPSTRRVPMNGGRIRTESALARNSGVVPNDPTPVNTNTNPRDRPRRPGRTNTFDAPAVRSLRSGSDAGAFRDSRFPAPTTEIAGRGTLQTIGVPSRDNLLFQELRPSKAIFRPPDCENPTTGGGFPIDKHFPRCQVAPLKVCSDEYLSDRLCQCEEAGVVAVEDVLFVVNDAGPVFTPLAIGKSADGSETLLISRSNKYLNYFRFIKYEPLFDHTVAATKEMLFRSQKALLLNETVFWGFDIFNSMASHILEDLLDAAAGYVQAGLHQGEPQGGVAREPDIKQDHTSESNPLVEGPVPWLLPPYGAHFQIDPMWQFLQQHVGFPVKKLEIGQVYRAKKVYFPMIYHYTAPCAMQIMARIADHVVRTVHSPWGSTREGRRIVVFVKFTSSAAVKSGHRAYARSQAFEALLIRNNALVIETGTPIQERVRMLASADIIITSLGARGVIASLLRGIPKHRQKVLALAHPGYRGEFEGGYHYIYRRRITPASEIPPTVNGLNFVKNPPLTQWYDRGGAHFCQHCEERRDDIIVKNVVTATLDAVTQQMLDEWPDQPPIPMDD